ncbi:hypothetical protein [Metallosphaera hakonensis]|uniref:Uncharacterized protein n=1 Tax=Metallosphaera hakonensis JCM 8857 = DSM 7519 TaxID=1293036 RepID=A0A2U9IV26_9CREN|nr:hypothetical protein [Metallosphaera hakonensis]AWR99855.1 hypothetical protein DFR87_09305 [Metallosphaera hakonensis JCM 8857 = DSM 7519]
MEEQKESLIKFLKERGGSAPRSALRKYSDDVLREMELEGKIKLQKVGSGIRVVLLDATTSGSAQNQPTVLDLLKEINAKLDLLLSTFRKGNELEFDRVFEEVKNPMGIAVLKDIRERMGLSREEFYPKFSTHIESHYQLFRGGEEGIVKGGVIFGLIKR